MTASPVGHTHAEPSAELAACAAELVACGSLEMSPGKGGEAAQIAALLPVGTRVYVNHLPRRAAADQLPTLVELHEAGLDPVPHLAARRIASREEARSFLEQAVARAGVTKVLLVGGDEPQPRGPYRDGVELLRDGVLAQAGIREVGMAGYPEGHPRIAAESLRKAMAEKVSAAAEQGLGAYVVTQFSFAPARVVEYCSMVAHQWPSLSVFVGLAGPTDGPALLRFAQRCGVSASLRALKDQGMSAVRLVTHTDPGEQLAAVARYCLSHVNCNVVGIHLFSFGGVAKTAGWMSARLAARDEA